MVRVFFSYCHKDEDLRDRLEVHLAMLKREGTIETWHDRRISLGDDWKGNIDDELERADLVLLLVSPDFLNSYYCFDVEMQRAIERHESGEARVVPIILKPCDWRSAPFQKLQAAPKDGKPIVSWADLDEAFLNVVQLIRAAMKNSEKKQEAVKQRSASAASLTNKSGVAPEIHVGGGISRSSNLRLKKTFSEAERDRFLEEGFEFMARFFESSLGELQTRNTEIECSFKRIDSNRFIASIYKNGESKARCKISLGGPIEKGISYSGNDRLDDNSMNESVHVACDDHGLYFKAMGMPNLDSISQVKLTFEGSSEYYWQLLIRKLQ